MAEWSSFIGGRAKSYCEQLFAQASETTFDIAWQELSNAYDELDGYDSRLLNELYAVDALVGYDHTAAAYKNVRAKHDSVRHCRQGVWQLWEALSDDEAVQNDWPKPFIDLHNKERFCYQRWDNDSNEE